MLPLLEESHVLLSDTTSYMFSDSAHYRHMTIVASVSVNSSVDMEKVNSIDSRSLAANVEDMSYGDNAISLLTPAESLIMLRHVMSGVVTSRTPSIFFTPSHSLLVVSRSWRAISM